MTRYIGILDGRAGDFGIHVPDLPGCVAMGATLEAAYSDAVEAVRLWAQDAVADGEALPAARDMDALRADADISRELADGSTFVAVPLLLDRGRPTRANISVDTGLLEAIDAAARERGLTRSAFLISAAKDKIMRGA